MKKLTTLVCSGGIMFAAAACDVPEAGPAPGQTQQAVNSNGAIAGQYLVKFRPGAGAAARAAAVAAGGNVVLDLPKHDLFAATLPAAALTGLSNNPNVEYVEPDAARYPMAANPMTDLDTVQIPPYGVAMVLNGASPAATPDNRTVCIIDSGYDLGHPDLPTTNVTGSPISNGLAWNEDTCGHGSHVAGTITAVDNGLGVIGVDPGVKLHIVRVFGGNSSDPACGWTGSSTLINALDACVAAGANVVSMSLGGSLRSRSEDMAFLQAYNAGVLPIAAAGNDGNTRKSYPASYDAVMSVAAIDEAEAVADFSQQNSAVEIAAPGVDVWSTLPSTIGKTSSLSTGDAVAAMDGSPNDSVTATVFACDSANNDCTGATGQICLIQRGTYSFSDKVLACQNAGGVGAIIYDNVVEPMLYGTLGGVDTAIPSVGTTAASGAALASVSGPVTLTVGDYGYGAWSGTSMATPHVSAVAALVWSSNTSCTPDQIRTALDGTAKDLGAAGRDVAFGYGLVDAAAALAALDCGGGGGGGGSSGCDVTGCASGEVCDTSTNQCRAFDCNVDGCSTGETCNTSTNQCESSGGTGPNACSFGTPDQATGCACDADSQCYFGKCKGKPGSQTCN